MRFFSFLLLFTTSVTLNAQCFDIQSILVDACAGSQEGQNEMVIFKVGNTALNTSNMSVTWPNNSWLGLTQNSGTAADIATVNSTILGCGFLKEPVAGILPANSKVLLVTSTAWTPLAQSFVNLTDTLIVIFQTAGNTAGHFANYQAGGGLRTLTLSFSSPSGCSDAVTYDRSLLIKQNLAVGAQDGGAVEFTPSGTATYVNHGCQAPFIPLSVDAGTDHAICAGSTQTLTATSSGIYTTVNWSPGAGATGTFTPSNSLTTTYTPGLGDNGTIKLYCTISKACGTQTTTVTDSTNLTILQVPVPVISAASNTICSGSSTTLTYSLTNAANTGTTSALWLPGGATTSSVSVNSANIYSVQVSNACGSNTSTLSVSTVPVPSVTISAQSLTACPQATVFITAASNVGNLSWSNPASTNSAVVLSSSTTTTGIVTTSNACGSDTKTYTLTVIPTPTVSVDIPVLNICTGQSVIVTATSSAATYTWAPAGINTNTISLGTTGVYTVSTSNACGSASETVTVTTGATPFISIVPTQTLLCGNQTALLSITGSQGNIIWNNSATSGTIAVNTAGVYSATLTNACGTATANVAIASLPNPTVSINPPSALLCPGHTATLTATSNAGNYSWNTGDNTSVVYTANTGVYTVSVTNACGTGTASSVINPISFPSLTLTATSNTICPGGTATLTATGGVPFVTGSSLIYNWSNSASTGSVVTTNGGTITVSNTNVCGTNTASIIVNVMLVNASVAANPISGVKPLLVDFTNNSTGASVYVWNFGNGNTAGTQTVSPQVYNTGGTYWVKLYASNGTCSDLDSVMITVYNEEPGLIIPNVFTPNGDSANDVFKVKAFNILDFDCIIYDRWGLEMYHWSDVTQGWDGKSNGKDVPEGTYFYLIRAKDADNKDIKKQGTVNLFK